jgi:toxin ParE1/3/4
MHIRWTKSASQNLLQIEDYVAKDNPKAAVKTVLKIIDTVETLLAHPELGREGRVASTRELIAGKLPYIVAYRVKDNSIEILRVLHTAMRWPEKL